MSQIHSDLKGKRIKINPLTDYYKSVFSVLFRGIINILPSLHNFPMASKTRVRLSLFPALCLVLCSRSFSFCFKRGFISLWSWQFAVHRFLCLYWIAIVIFSGIIRFTFVNDDFNFHVTLGCSFASCKYCLRCKCSNWWTSARWLANLTRYFAPHDEIGQFLQTLL